MRERSRDATTAASLLTPRERQIINLVAAGATNATIARELAISPRTVQTHLDNLFNKLGVRKRAAAVARVLR
jgi:DNA-binding CsgD family transcriptional regulator